MNVRELAQRHAALAAAILLSVIHLSTFDVGRLPIITDIRYFVYFSWQVAEGAVPHLDYFENKTELATYVGAALYTAADLVGADPLRVMRLGTLGLAGVAGLLLFFVLRALGGGSGVAGLLGVAAYCSFGLLGLLPAIGPIPKLLMSLCASAAALATYRERWFLAGVCGALAFMDWQVGGLVLAAAAATALVFDPRPARAVACVALGGASGFAPFGLYYLYHGAFSEFVRQVIGASLFRGSEVAARVGLVERLVRIVDVAERACPAHAWLLLLALPGLAVAVVWAWRWRREARGRLLLPLLLCHVGVFLFSLIDFQAYGDFFLILHGLALFLGVTWVALYELAHVAFPRGGRVVTAAALILILAVARPGPLRPRFNLLMRHTHPEMTLQDQQEVASALARLIGDGRVAFLNDAEALFLMRRKNELPVVYSNLATWKHFRTSDAETNFSTGVRLLLSADADAIVSPDAFGYGPFLERGYELVTLTSANERCSVTVALRPRPGGD